MWNRRQHEDGRVTCGSGLLHAAGLSHAVTTRVGPSASLCNVMQWSEQDRRQFLACLLLSHATLVTVKQVHGCECCPSTQALASPCQADALTSQDASHAVGVRIADCVPVLLASEDGSTVAAVHAGWRGLAAGVIQRTLHTLIHDQHIPPARLLAAIGPCISQAHFEVGQDVAQQMRSALGSLLIAAENEGLKPRIDLPRTAEQVLLAAGLQPEHIDRCEMCTFASADLHSHRRDQEASGRMLAVIAPRQR